MSEVHLSLDDPSQAEAWRDDLAAALASRICHDLTSPLGAIANGVELLVLSGAERSPEMDLIADSVDSANARIRFFRLAYGAAGQQDVSRSEILRTLDGISRSSRTTYAWEPEGDRPRIEVKAVFLLLQCLESALPMGGRLRVAQQGATWVVSAEGQRLRTGLAAWRVLDSAGGDLPEGSGVVQFALLAGVLSRLGRPLVLSEGADRIEARF